MVDSEQSFPRKSPNYLYAQSVFFTQFNDIDFYIEDEHKESLYFSILSRLFRGVRIDRIFPLGGKKAVIQHAQVPPQGRQSVHILDKDFDDLLGATVAFPTVVYLDRYCLENYILEPLAICRFIVAEKPTLTEAAVKMRFNVEKFLCESIADLRSVFFCFFLVQKHDLQMPNTSQSVARFSHGRDRWRIESTRVKQYERRVVAAVGHKSIDFATERRAYASAFELNRRKRFSGANISGKYLLALLLPRITSLFGVRGTNLDSATYRIAEYCNLAALRKLQEQITKLLVIRS
jgi:hypothetical protein